MGDNFFMKEMNLGRSSLDILGYFFSVKVDLKINLSQNISCQNIAGTCIFIPRRNSIYILK